MFNITDFLLILFFIGVIAFVGARKFVHIPKNSERLLGQQRRYKLFFYSTKEEIKYALKFAIAAMVVVAIVILLCEMFYRLKTG